MSLLIRCADLSADQEKVDLEEVLDIAQVLQSICDQIIVDSDPHIFLSKASNSLVLLFRDLWLSIILLLPSSDELSSEWKNILHSIATVTPPMLMLSDKKNLQADLASNSILGGAKIPDDIQSKIKNTYIQFSGPNAARATNVEITICAYLSAFYNCEKYREKGKYNAEYILMYLSDDRNNEQLFTFYSIADEIMKIQSQNKFEFIQENVRTLLTKATHYLPKIREFCFNNIENLLKLYPQLLWDKRLVHLMLDVLRVLDYETDAKFRNKVKEQEPNLCILFLDSSTRIATLDFYQNLCITWLNNSLIVCPKEIGGLFQSYISKNFIEIFAFIQSSDSRLSTLFRKFFQHEAFSTSIVPSLIKQGNYIGEIRGMVDLIRLMDPLEDEKSALKSITAKVKSKLHGLLYGNATSYSDEKFAEEYCTYLHRAGAILLYSEMVLLLNLV